MKTRLFSSLIALSATPAFADLTAEQVLADQLNLLSGNGRVEVETTSTETRPDGLVIGGYRALIKEENGDEVEVLIGGATLHEPGDGSVEIIYPDRLPITVRGDDGEIEEMTIWTTVEDMRHVVSRDPHDITLDVTFTRLAFDEIETKPADIIPSTLEHEFSISNAKTRLRLTDSQPLTREANIAFDQLLLQMNLPEAVESSEFSEIETIDAHIELNGFNAVMSFVDGDILDHSLDLSFASFDWEQMMSGTDVDGFIMSIQANDFALDYDIALSPDDLEEDFAAALLSGQGVKANLGYEDMSMHIEGETPDGTFRTFSSAGESTATLGFGKDGFSMVLSSVDGLADMAFPHIPDFPLTNLTYGIELTTADIAFPLLPSEERQDFRFKLAYRGLDVSDSLWSIFDPEARIPRDPADLVLDLEGSTLVSENIFEAEDGNLPFRQSEVTLNEFLVSAAGLALTASGEGRETSAEGETPSGVGSLSARMTGFNTLLDTLTDMGLLPGEQATAARFGLALFARQVEGEDTLTSDIEIREDGSIHANGQRIK